MSQSTYYLECGRHVARLHRRRRRRAYAPTRYTAGHDNMRKSEITQTAVTNMTKNRMLENKII